MDGTIAVSYRKTGARGFACLLNFFTPTVDLAYCSLISHLFVSCLLLPTHVFPNAHTTISPARVVLLVGILPYFFK